MKNTLSAIAMALFVVNGVYSLDSEHQNGYGGQQNLGVEHTCTDNRVFQGQYAYPKTIDAYLWILCDCGNELLKVPGGAANAYECFRSVVAYDNGGKPVANDKYMHWMEREPEGIPYIWQLGEAYYQLGLLFKSGISGILAVNLELAKSCFVRSKELLYSDFERELTEIDRLIALKNAN